jgi:hypothetical protein
VPPVGPVGPDEPVGPTNNPSSTISPIYSNIFEDVLVSKIIWLFTKSINWLSALGDELYGPVFPADPPTNI